MKNGKLSRREVLGTVAAGAAGALVGWPRVGHAADVTLKLGHVLAPSHQFQKGMELAAAKVAEATAGRVKIQVFPSSQLGTERDMHVAIRSGGIDMMLGAPGGANVHLKQLTVIDAPYLFRDVSHWKAVVYGPIGDEWAKETLKNSGVHLVGWFDRGTRHVISRQKAYNTIGDMKGQKVRVADFPPYPQVFKALGAVPTPIAFAEMYNALQAGIVDGADTPLDTILAQKLFEVSKYVNLISWSTGAPGVILMSDNAFKSVSEQDRPALLAALRAGSELISEAYVSGEANVKKELAVKGMELVTPKDMDAWRAAAAAAIPELAATWGGDVQLYYRIRDYKA